MKKWIAALLSAGMVICCVIVPVRAETEEKARKSPVLESALVAPELEKKPVYDNRGAASAALTGDAVTFDAENGTFEVVTAAGTQMTVSVPFGAYCITQDVFQQLDIYMSLYSDVGAALKYYVGNGIHMDIFDFYTGSSTYISESEDPLASLIGEMNPLDETKLKSVADYMSKNWYGESPAVTKTVGGNCYVAFDMTEDYGFAVYNHITNGKLIEVYTYCDNGAEGMALMDSMIEGLRFGTAE